MIPFIVLTSTTLHVPGTLKVKLKLTQYYKEYYKDN